MTATDVTPDVTPDVTAVAEPQPEAGVLRPASATAARERERLAQRDGRSGLAALVAGVLPGLRRLGSEEAAVSGLRYRPVAWTVIAVAAVSLYLPGRVDRVAPPQVAAAPSAVDPVDGPEPSGATTVPPVVTSPVDPGSGFTPPSADPFEPPGSDSGVDAPTAPPPSAPDGGPSVDPSPLTVRGMGWASRLPATPLPGDEVPDGSFPVANRLGSVDRVSFVRLAGDATVLVLAQDTEASREALGAGAVAACPIEGGDWEEEPAQSFDDAPTWSEDSCVAGVARDGRWSFDLSSFDDRTGDAGFALVPTVDAPADFQVVFTLTTG